MNKVFEKFDFKKRLTSMLKLDLRRLFTSNFFYIILGSSLIIPILILIMTKMMEGSPINDQYGNPVLDEFGNPILMEGFKNVWQMLGSVNGDNTSMKMDLVSMCNINMMYFGVGILISMFISQEFRSGYVKNLFCMRSGKGDYVISKTIIGSIGGILIFILFLVGSILGGLISGISFEMVDFNISNIIMCFLSKLGLILVFVSVFVLMSVVGKEKLWLSMISGLGVSMLLFMMISIISPLNSTIMNVLLSVIGGIIFSYFMGLISNLIFKRTNLI